MKRIKLFVMVCMLAAVCAACQVSKEKNVFELIRVSPAAKARAIILTFIVSKC